MTIGIPFYNCARYLPNVIRSIYAQTYTDWEVIFVDDGSSDGSLEIVRAIKDSRVTICADGKHLGIGARRRQLVDMTRTRYLAWLDADDMMHPDRLAVQCEFLENHDQIACVDSSCYIVDPDLNLVRTSHKKKGIVPASDMALTPQMLNTAILARTAMYTRVRFNPKHRRVEDWDVWIRASKEYVFYHLDQCLSYVLNADLDQRPRMDRELSEPRFLLRTYLEHGRAHLGLARTALLVLRLCARTAYRIVVILLGQHKYLKAARTANVTDEERLAAEAGLKVIRETRVPGLNE